MGLDPRLRNGLMERGSEVSAGCALLDEFEPCQDARRGCRDAPWACSFCVVVVGVVYTAKMYSDDIWDAATKSRGSGFFEDPVEAEVIYKTLLIAILGAGLATFGAALFFLEITKRFTACVCWATLMFGPALCVLFGLSLMLSGSTVYGMLGIALVCLGLCYGSCVACCWRDMIPFTVLLVQTAIHVTKQHPFIFIISVAGAGLAVCWSLLCGYACLGIYTVHRSQDAYRGRPADHLYFIQCFVFLWGSMVATNAAQVACCGVFGRWYFGKDQGSPVTLSLKAAVTTSFGSICFGSFIVAVIRALEFTLRQMQQVAEDEGNIVVCILLVIVRSIVGCVGDIMEWLNEFAYVQCAVRGLGFLESARATFALCTFSNCNLIVADSLVGSIVLLGSLAVSFVGTGTAWILFVSLVEGHPVRLHIGSGLAFLVSLVTARATLQPLQSGATTMVVCWAENPSGLARTRPELAKAFAERGNCWDDIDTSRASLRPSVEARTLQPNHAQRQLTVTVPPGVGPGETVQVTSPEGQLLQVQVPLGYGPGQQFIAAY